MERLIYLQQSLTYLVSSNSSNFCLLFIIIIIDNKLIFCSYTNFVKLTRLNGIFHFFKKNWLVNN